MTVNEELILEFNRILALPHIREKLHALALEHNEDSFSDCITDSLYESLIQTSAWLEHFGEE